MMNLFVLVYPSSSLGQCFVYSEHGACPQIIGAKLFTTMTKAMEYSDEHWKGEARPQEVMLTLGQVY